MVAALELKTNEIDRHFLLLGIVTESYKRRSDPKMAELCARVAEMHISEFPKIAGPLKREMDGQAQLKLPSSSDSVLFLR